MENKNNNNSKITVVESSPSSSKDSLILKNIEPLSKETKAF